MAFTELAAAREALHAVGQTYKDLVRASLVAEGYRITSDSSISGSLSDLVATRDQEELRVETKDTDLSLKDKDFVDELIRYFREWANRPPDSRFGLRIYARKLVGHDNWRKIFEAYNSEATEDWLSWVAKKLPELHGELLAADDGEKFTQFLAEVEVSVAPRDRLVWASQQTAARHLADWQKLGQERLERARRLDAPINRRSTVVTNLVRVDPPAVVYEYRTRFDSPKAVYQEFKGYPVPPFYWIGEGSLLSFEGPVETNPYADAIEVREHTRDEFEKANPHWVQRLVQEHARAIAKALRLWSDGHYLFAPVFGGRDEVLLSVGGGNRAKFSRLLRYQEDTEYAKKNEVNFGLHEAIEISAFHVDGAWHLVLKLGRTYTTDGRQVIEDGKHRDRIDRKLRNQPQNRNQGRLDVLRDWYGAIFHIPPGSLTQIPLFEQERIHWIRLLKPGPLVAAEVPWSPQAVDSRTTTLEGFT